jgi:hypothetical protein
MPEPERHVVLLSSLRGLVRGLSSLFWGLPVALVIAVQTTRGDWLKPSGLASDMAALVLGIAPVLLAMLLLLYGVWMMGNFQTQERIWMSALHRARFVATINVGLSPFLFFWSKVSAHWFFNVTVGLMVLSMLAFLYLLNLARRNPGLHAAEPNHPARAHCVRAVLFSRARGGDAAAHPRGFPAAAGSRRRTDALDVAADFRAAARGHDDGAALEDEGSDHDERLLQRRQRASPARSLTSLHRALMLRAQK